MDRRDVVDPAGGQRAVEVDLRRSGDRSGHSGAETSGSGNDREQDEEDGRNRLRATTAPCCGTTFSTGG
jgi:hypothetical protein